MIVGIVTFISILFFGGAAELFFVDDIEKGVKKYVQEKERKKDILSELKQAKKISKAFEKDRKSDYKRFKKLYADKTTTTKQLESFFEELQNSRTGYQNEIVEKRLHIYEKIKPEEWVQIISESQIKAEKRIAKINKKEAKRDNYFAKTRSQITLGISNIELKTRLLNEIDQIENSIKSLEDYLLSVNTIKNEILADKDSDKKELMKIVIEENSIRAILVKELIDLHSAANEGCTDNEWNKIMKTLSKEFQMSSR